MPARATTTDSQHRSLSEIPLLDAEGSKIPIPSVIEQIAVDEANGAREFRLHRQGQVVGRSARHVCVIFHHEYHVSDVRSDLVRLAPQAD